MEARWARQAAESRSGIGAFLKRTVPSVGSMRPSARRASRRFAAARFAHESHDLARADLQVDVLQDVPGTAAAEKALPRDVAVAGDADIGDDGKLGVLNGQGRKARGARRRIRGGGEERGVAAGAPAAVLDGRHGAETFAAGVRDARAARGEGTARAELVGGGISPLIGMSRPRVPSMAGMALRRPSV